MPPVSLYVRNGIWYLDYYHQGRRHRVSTKTGNRKLAEIRAHETEVQLFKGELPSGTDQAITISELIRRYLAQSENTKARTTYRTEHKQLKIWREFFARAQVAFPSMITHELISRFQSEVKVSHRTQNNLIAVLKTVLNRGVEWGLIQINPIARFKKIRIPRKIRYFQDEELERLSEAAQPREKAIIALGAYAGLRRGEMTHLTWRDLDFRTKTITVRSDEEFTPKGKRPRSIPMHRTVIEALLPIRPKKPDDLPVFPRSPGSDKISGLNRLTREFAQLLRHVGLKGRLHDLRHTFGSRLVRAGVPLPVVQELMGHTDIGSTMVYVHLYPGQHREAVERL